MRALKTGALYFALVFEAGWVLGPVRELCVVPHIGRTAGVLLEAPLMLGTTIIAARWTIRRVAVSSALGPRAAVGLVALGMLLIAEVIGARWLRGLLIRDYVAGFFSVAGCITILLFLLFAAMPLIVERWPRATGHITGRF